MDRIDRQHSITLYAYLYISAIHIILCIEAGVTIEYDRSKNTRIYPLFENKPSALAYFRYTLRQKKCAKFLDQ